MKIGTFVFLGAILILLAVNNVEGRVLIRDRVLIDQEKVEEMFAIANDINVTGDIDNEFFGIARTIKAKTDIDGDFIAVALNIIFSGSANDDIYLIGNLISASGSVGGSLNALGKNIEIRADIEGNVRAGAEELSIVGDIGGKATLWGKDVLLQGRYNELTIYANNIDFRPGTVVTGDLVYFTPEELNLSSITVEGLTQWNKPVGERIMEKGAAMRVRKIYSFFSLLIPFLIMFWLFPNLLQQTAYTTGSKFPHCYGAGLLLIILTVIALPVVFITIIGAPLGLIITSVLISSIYLSRVLPAIYLGRKMLFRMKDTRSTWVLSILIGVLVFTVISFHPTAKLILHIISVPAGLGGIVAGRVKLIKRLREERIL